MLQEKLIVLIPASGIGTRFGGQIPKQYLLINGKPILQHTVEIFLGIEIISEIIIVVHPSDPIIANFEFKSPKVKVKRLGGETRAHTVLNGLSSINCSANSWVLVHDAVRCALKRSTLLKLINEIQDNEVGGILATPVIYTLKLVNKSDKTVQTTLDRSNLYLAQTPQMFRYRVLKEALEKSDLSKITDEAQAIENIGLAVKIVEGEVTNIKVTTPDDLPLVTAILNLG